MSISLALSIGFITSSIDCAPKIGHILFEPIIYESYDTRKYRNVESNEQKATNNKDDEILGMNLLTPSNNTNMGNKTNKISCSGYDYNVNICKIISDRLLCGYNKNIGDATTKIIDLGNGCRLRNNRLECGYIKAPISRLKRPPTNNNNMDNFSTSSQFPFEPNSQVATVDKDNKLSSLSSEKDYSEKNMKANFKGSKNPKEKSLRMISSIETSPSVPTLTSLLLHTTTTIEKVSRVLKKHCVETGGNIFCYSSK